MSESLKTDGSAPDWRARQDAVRSQGGARHGVVGQSRHRDLYAALDLGTNNCRLLIASPTADGFRVVDAFSRIVRLGEGLTQHGRLGSAAISRTMRALKVCRDKVASTDVLRSRFVATEACRIAENGPAFLDDVYRELGLDLEVIDRRTEAELAVNACQSLIDRSAAGVLLFDIGGGSTEIAWLEPVDATRHGMRAWASLPFGVVNLSERFGGRDVTPAIFDAMIQEVRNQLPAFGAYDRIVDVVKTGSVHMMATSGTATTLAGIHLGLRRYDRARVDGLWLGGASIDAAIGGLLAMTHDERCASPCIGVNRALFVLAGCAILQALRDEWGIGPLRVADRGLREGILRELMEQDAREPQPA